MLIFILMSLLAAQASQEVPGRDLHPRVLERSFEDRTGDLPDIRKHGLLRVLTTYNRTNFFFAGRELRGFEYELLDKFEDHLNDGTPRGGRKTSLVFVPVAKEDLIPYLVEGKGDIAAAGLTVTDGRLEHVAFTDPYLEGVDEIVVTSNEATGLESIDDLAGRSVYVVRGSSYVEHLNAISQRLYQFGRPRINVVEMESFLETEDIFEMLNANIVDVAVADRHLAELWSGVLDGIVPRPDLVINHGGRLSWAVRRDNSELLATVNEFMKSGRKGTLLGNVLFNRYYEGTKWVSNPFAGKDPKEIRSLLALFKEYGEKYDIDWIAVAAFAYQESRFNQNLRSRAGAVGVMQVKPETAAHMGISNIEDVRNNVHAGVKYLAWLRDTYVNEPEIDHMSRVAFLCASYNAGPSRISRLRRKAPELGYNSDVWRNEVERVVLSHVGSEPVDYVSGIFKYYVAFKMADQTIRDRQHYTSERGSTH